MTKAAPGEGDPDFKVWQVGYKQGKADGEVGMRAQVIDFVTNRYIDIHTGPERGTPEAKVYLDLLRGIGKELKLGLDLK